MAFALSSLSLTSASALRSARKVQTVQRAPVAVRAADSSEPSEPGLTESQIYAKGMAGVTAPFPDVFDPAGFLKTGSVKDVRRWREAELTHGRVSMLAALGFIIGEQLEDFPVFMNFDGNITGPAINQFQQVQQGFWEPLLIVIGIAESYRVSLAWATPTGTGFNSLKDDYEMGNLSFDPLGLTTDKSPEELKELRTKELNNGRLAMIAIAAFVAQELVNNTEIFEHLFRGIELEFIEELDDVERELNLPVTPIPDIVKAELNL